jgi:alpha-1,2-mannosyltransferase
MNAGRLSAWLSERLLVGKLAGAALWVVWIASLVFGSSKINAQDERIWFDWTPQLLGADHLAFYSAAKLIQDGRGDVLYDYNALADYQSDLIGTRFLEAYRNPPFYALLYLPTARLNYVVSFWIWTAVALALLWLGIRWLSPARPGTVLLWALCFYPIFAAVSFGQNSLLSFAAFCLTFRQLDHNKPFSAGLAAGLLLYKPQLLLGLGLWWLLDFRVYWRALAGLTVTGLVLLGLSFLTMRAETIAFVEHLPQIAAYDAFWFYNLHTPRGFWTLLLGDNKYWGGMLGWVCSLIALGGFLVFWRRHRGDMPLLFAAAVFVTLWASPHTMVYDWSLVLIPVVVLWERRPQQRDQWLPLFAAGWAVLFISTQLAQWMFKSTGAALQLSVPVLAILAILAARVLGRQPPSNGKEAIPTASLQ